jgi:2-C-methyl-D-erythritol 2,4-cyclodiphosphate synthase
MNLRVGSGFDAHGFTSDPERTLILGGVAFPGEQGLEGHSDADAVAHACTDAVLGAAGLGDIGQLFPDTDPVNKGADSIVMLGQAVSRAAAGGWIVLNIDCTLVAERPRVAPHRGAMEQRLSEAVGASVTVKATTTEGMGAFGRGEGIGCWAVALLEGDPGASS